MHYFAVSEMNKKSCVLCGQYLYKNRTFHGRLGIRILSSSAESISYKDKIKIRIPAWPWNILYLNLFTDFKLGMEN